jgi:DeoR/GlpR family transcriptional regulator of sugar metabolism
LTYLSQPIKITHEVAIASLSPRSFQDFPVLVEERRQKVLDLVSQRGFIALTELAQVIEASESTLRRDLDYWNHLGLLKRTHGGAMFVGDGQTLPALEERSASQLDEKREIARAASGRIHDGDAILLDGGTTTLEVARLLVGRSLQIVTNSLPIANLFASSRETDLVILGGYVYPKTGVALGPLTVRMMEEVHVHQAIMSVGGITAKGLFNSNLLLVETERRMMRCADEVVVVADHSKIGRQALAFLCELSAVDTLIVDRNLSAAQRELVDQADARLIVAGESVNGTSAKEFQP